MIRKLALAACVAGSLISVAGTAHAEMAPSMGNEWAGAHLGLQMGKSFGNNALVNRNAGTVTSYQNVLIDGQLIGAYGGYTIQHDIMVVGIDADLIWSGMGTKGLVDVLDSAGVPIPPNSHSVDVNWTGAVRARGGFALGPALFYLAGGLAVANAEYTHLYGGVTQTLNATMLGWTGGGGVELAANEHVTLRLEYRYSDYGKASCFCFPAFPAFESRETLAVHDVRIGIAYNF